MSECPGNGSREALLPEDSPGVPTLTGNPPTPLLVEKPGFGQESGKFTHTEFLGSLSLMKRKPERR